MVQPPCPFFHKHVAHMVGLQKLPCDCFPLCVRPRYASRASSCTVNQGSSSLGSYARVAGFAGVRGLVRLSPGPDLAPGVTWYGLAMGRARTGCEYGMRLPRL